LSPPTSAELQALVQRISERIGRQMERKGLLARDAESSYLALEPGGEEGALADLQGHSITYRIALGPHKGRKAFLLQSLAPRGEERAGECVVQANGFSLHAGIAAEAEQRQKLERLCRYIARPAVAIERLSRSAQGTIRYAEDHRLHREPAGDREDSRASGAHRRSAWPPASARTASRSGRTVRIT
jgi:hypothetical protein